MLPTQASEPVVPVFVCGINLTYRAKWEQLVVCATAVFVFYIGYGYVQELIFRLEGVRPFGWYLTLVQFCIYSVLAYTEGIYAQLALYTVATMGLSNASVGYLNYPTQVIFKSCKLIPVLIGGILIQGKRYGILDIAAACMMSMGLALFTLSDSQVSPNFDPKGYVMISLALIADAIIGNVQEKAMKAYDASNNEVVLYSYSLGCIYIFFGTVFSGEFVQAFVFFKEHPKETYGYALIFGLLGYAGVNVVLTLVKRFGALIAVTVTTVRKALTIVLSFLVFSKPFTLGYVWSGLIVLLAIYLSVYSRNQKQCNEALTSLFRSRRQRSPAQMV